MRKTWIGACVCAALSSAGTTAFAALPATFDALAFELAPAPIANIPSERFALPPIVPDALVQGGDWIPVAQQELDTARGGFTLDTGLKVSLGIEREISINGDVVSRTSLQLGDLASMNADQARQTREALSSVNLVQNGRDNIYMAAGAQTLGGTIVQNSLNDQLIRSHTVIHSSVNSMALLKTINFHGSLSDAIAASVNPR